MNEETTLILTVLGGILTLVSLWGSRRKLPLGQVSLVPWNGIMFVGVLAFVLGIAHLAALNRGGL